MLFRIQKGVTATSIAVCMAFSALSAQAQDDGADDAIEEIIVTGVARPTTKFESSASVTSLGADDMMDYAPRSTAEVLRNLPGIQSESSSGDANANIKVRGMPISSGGARYLSFQEDGFPALLIGDVAFATADSFIRVDSTISSVQSIRGGTAMTQAFNSPGGIVNFISKDGSEEGGSVGVTSGLNYDSLRLDAEYGGSLANDWTYHVGGFFRTGEGPRDSATDVEEGYQLKATLARRFDRGSVKFHFKRLDDVVPTYLPFPAQYNGGGFSEAGVDFADGTLLQGFVDCAPRQGNAIECVDEGFEAEMTSFAVVADYDLTDILTVGFRHRTAAISGSFASPFPAIAFDDPTNGPSVQIHYFNTKLDDLDNSNTDLKLSAELETFTAMAGIALMDQNITTVWNFNEYYRLLDADRTPYNTGDSVGGVLYGNPTWGNCCTRLYDYEVEAMAPYLAFSGTIADVLGWDVSYRQNDYDVSGVFAESTVLVPLDVDGDGQIGANEQEVPTIGATSPYNYDQDFDSWSVGFNYAATDSVALFVNYSEGGGLAAPDRITGNLNADGTLDDGAGYAEISQAEVGVKWQFDNGSLYVTYFDADTDEERAFEVTTQLFLQNSYESSGLEIEGDIDFGNGFGVRGSMTFTDAEIVNTASGDNIGNKPRRQADYIFNITPSYTADNWEVGVNFVGTDEVFVQDSNDLKFDSYVVANLFANWYVNDNFSVSLNANNLFDEDGFTEGEEGSASAGDFVRIRSINGQSASLTLQYDFF